MTTSTHPTIPVNGQFIVDGNNVIKTSQNDIEAGYVQFSLSVASNISWWKGIKIFDKTGNMVALISTQDNDRGPNSSRKMPLGDFGDQIRLEIWKAKGAGIHWNLDTVWVNLSECSGKNTLFYWVND